MIFRVLEARHLEQLRQVGEPRSVSEGSIAVRFGHEVLARG